MIKTTLPGGITCYDYGYELAETELYLLESQWKRTPRWRFLERRRIWKLLAWNLGRMMSKAPSPLARHETWDRWGWILGSPFCG